MRKYIIQDISNNKYLCCKKPYTKYQELETKNFAKLINSAKEATIFDYKQQAQDLIDEAINRTSLSESIFIIVEINVQEKKITDKEILLEKQVFENTCYWREIYVDSLNSGFTADNRADTIIRAFVGTNLQHIKDIDALRLSKEANIPPETIRAVLHDFVRFVKQKIEH